MAVWAYECRGTGGEEAIWFVSRSAVDEMPPDVREVRVKVGSEWLPAVVDRTQAISVEGMLVREFIVDDAE